MGARPSGPGPIRARTRLAALSANLRGKRFQVEPGTPGIVVHHPDQPKVGIRVECRERPSDNDELWFWHEGEPLIEADHTDDAALAILARLNKLAAEEDRWL